jgi:hypothetical protein
MTISAYQVDCVIKAYSKQNRVKANPFIQQSSRPGDTPSGDVVTLSVGKSGNDEVYKAISYNLLDVLLKTKDR